MKTIDPVMIKKRFFCPGPTPLPEEFGKFLSTEFYHRTDEFYQIVRRCRKLLGELIHSKNEPLLITSSGTAAMEAAVVNFTAEGDKRGKLWRALGKNCRCLRLPSNRPESAARYSP